MNNVKTRFEVVAFIDDNVQKSGKNINGVPVLLFKNITTSYILMHRIEEIVVSTNHLDSQKLIYLIQQL